MTTATVLDREEYIEQAYFFRTLRERLATNVATQEVLERIDQEILATTRLPYAIQFLATELKHSGLLSSGFKRLGHYFTPYQAFIIACSEIATLRFNTDTALLVLEREAHYRSQQITSAGLFVYQFEVISRNRLGYDDGLLAMAADPQYDGDWKAYLELVRQQVGIVDFADLVYLRSDLYVTEQRRQDADYSPPVPPLFGTKEGRIARANRDRDPLYLFAALQRQLGYPEVPRLKPVEDMSSEVITLKAKLREMDRRLKLLESEVRGQIDLSQFGKPDLLRNEGEADEI